MLSLKPKCTCGGKNGMHYLNCDLFHGKLGVRHPIVKRKRFFIFYPLKYKGK